MGGIVFLGWPKGKRSFSVVGKSSSIKLLYIWTQPAGRSPQESLEGFSDERFAYSAQIFFLNRVDE